MNFDLDDEQQAVHDLAAQVFAGEAPPERVRAVERDPDPGRQGFDRNLWQALATTGLLGLVVPAQYGGSGKDMVELVLMLEQQGRWVAPVPLWGTLCAAMTIAEWGTDDQRARLLPAVAAGDTVLSSALAEPGANDVLHPSVMATPAQGDGGWRLTGWKPSVPFGRHADVVLVPARRPDGSVLIALVDLHGPGVTVEPVRTTNHEPQAHLALDVLVEEGDVLGGESADGLGALTWLFERALTGLCALALGVAQGSLALTAEHVSHRIQFGKPLSSFQAVGQRAADGYITTEAMRVTTLNAAWRLAEGLDARRDVLSAAFWATEGGQQVVLAGQHLHGGVGADIDYPVHRYFLWGTQLGTELGAASAHLARLGRLIATG
jgi:alkylation response protein AidB-like acyl-CoA dehydrogenase